LKELKSLIRDIPDFPKPGIVFKDITPLLKDPEGFRDCVTMLEKAVGRHGPCDAIVGIESRGFLFGAALAMKMGVSFVPIRKPGKLPYETISQSYELEYGSDSVEIHKDAFLPGQRIAIVDDLLATGGTMAASCKLVESLGATICACVFVVELGFLAGRKKLQPYTVSSLLEF
jgi:adenine phosphoribosyltransferase